MRKTGIAGLAFAAATSMALAFGGAQAFAAPSSAEAASAAAACTDRQCRRDCSPFAGYCDELRGYCVCAG